MAHQLETELCFHGFVVGYVGTCAHVRNDVYHVSLLVALLSAKKTAGTRKPEKQYGWVRETSLYFAGLGTRMEIVERVAEEALIQASSEELAQRPKGGRRRWADMFLDSCFIYIFPALGSTYVLSAARYSTEETIFAAT